MQFILLMTSFALALILILWLIFRSGKSRHSKKLKSRTKKIAQRKKGNRTLKPEPISPTGEQLRDNATKLLKKNPEVVSQVIRQWLRDK